MLKHGLGSHIEEAKGPNMFCAYKLEGNLQPHPTLLCYSFLADLLQQIHTKHCFSRGQGKLWSSV